jgi:hypothetical protein
MPAEPPTTPVPPNQKSKIKNQKSKILNRHSSISPPRAGTDPPGGPANGEKMDEMNHRWTQMDSDWRKFRALRSAFHQNRNPCPFESACIRVHLRFKKFLA